MGEVAEGHATSSMSRTTGAFKGVSMPVRALPTLHIDMRAAA